MFTASMVHPHPSADNNLGRFSIWLIVFNIRRPSATLTCFYQNSHGKKKKHCESLLCFRVFLAPDTQHHHQRTSSDKSWLLRSLTPPVLAKNLHWTRCKDYRWFTMLNHPKSCHQKLGQQTLTNSRSQINGRLSAWCVRTITDLLLLSCFLSSVVSRVSHTHRDSLIVHSSAPLKNSEIYIAFYSKALRRWQG